MTKFTAEEGIFEAHSENFDWIIDCDDEKTPVIFTLCSFYTGEQAPQVTFKTVTQEGEEIYVSNSYTVGKREEAVTNRWRIPPAVFKGAKFHICFAIPEGTKLCLRNYSLCYADYKKPLVPDVKFNAHLGFFGLAPENTIPAFELAGVCGFDSCITVPKVTKDGVFVCIHDDTINKRARDDSGNEASEEMAVADMTYEELLQWDFGAWKNDAYKGEKIPTLDKYFEICRDYGMKPFFSIHPNLSEEEWRKVREKLIRYDLLDKFQVKSSKIQVLESVFKVFGNEINCYTLWAMEYKDEMIETLAGLNADFTKVRGVIEFREKLDTENFTEEIVNKIKAAGFTASALSCWGRKTGEYYKRLISLGVSEFTEDYHCSFDLDW